MLPSVMFGGVGGGEDFMERFPCPHLRGPVELSEERERHVAERHPELLPEGRHRIAETLADPETVRRSPRMGNARLFSRWYDDLRAGKHVVVVVVSQSGDSGRHWIITAYIARRLVGGEIEWERS